MPNARMYRRYTVHRDGDLLVEELDADGKPLDPEPVLLAPDTVDGQSQLLDLLELALEMETTPEGEKQAVKRDGRPQPGLYKGGKRS